MKWLEIIELQASGYNKQELEQYLMRLCHDLSEGSNPTKFKIYENRDIDSDLSIHIFHSTDMPDSNQSPLGFHISSMLRSFGLVHRTTWTEHQLYKDKDIITHENE